MVWIDNKTAEPHFPFKNMEIVNSPLTEYAGLGFEVGYSWVKGPLVCWEAQYGDFDNGAQIIIDQYIACAEHKWNCLSSITLLLPHGYEGAGPEHSSARLERFLQLAANNNMQIVNPSTPAQYFHLLRRQALSTIRKPLIVLTPKSLLRSAANTSTLDAFTSGQFEEVLDDPEPPMAAKRIIFCSGKIFYDLINARQKKDVAIIRVEQLYPLNLELIKKFLVKYSGFTSCVWVQEEPENMGAWEYMRHFIPVVKFVGRQMSATTATGSSKKHKQEQQMLLDKAFSYES